jgi:hypothetical protein
MINFRLATREDVNLAMEHAKEVYDEAHLLECDMEGIKPGEAATLSDEHGNIGCVVGMALMWPGVASVWALTTKYLNLHPVGYTRTVRALLEDQVKSLGLHRVEMRVKALYFDGHRWAEALGFESEAFMKKYGSDGSDYVMYRRLF